MSIRTVPRWLALTALALVSWGCGGETDPPSSATGSQAAVSESESAAADLSGVRFEVHRDPG